MSKIIEVVKQLNLRTNVNPLFSYELGGSGEARGLFIVPNLSTDVAYEEIAGAKACYKEKITEDVYDLAYQHFHTDYHKVGRIPYGELEALIAKYAEQNKSKTYQIGEVEIICS